MASTRKLAWNTGIQLAGKVVSTLLGLIAIAMMTRYLGQEKFGWYTTVMAFLQFIAILIDFGLVPVTAQMLSEPKYDNARLFKNLLGFRFVTAIVFLGLAPFIALLFPWPIEVKIAVAFTTISMLAVAMNQVLLGYYQTKLKMHVQAIGEVIGRIVLVIGLLLLITNQAGFIPIMIIVTVGNVVYSLYMWLVASKGTPAGFAFDWHIWKAIACKMWPIAVAIMFNVLYLKGDTVLLTFFTSQEQVGIYGAAYRVIDILAQVAMMVMGIMLPLMAYSFSRNKLDDFTYHLQRAFDGMMFLAIPISLGVISIADDIMYIIAGEQFIQSAVPLRILSIGVFGLFLGAVFGHTAVSINKQKETLWVYASAAVLTIIGYILFIPKYTLLGAAWMTVFSELYVGILLWITVQKFLPVRLSLINFFKMLFAGIVMAALLWQLPDMHMLFDIAIGALVYLTIVIGTKAISVDTIKSIVSKQS